MEQSEVLQCLKVQRPLFGIRCYSEEHPSTLYLSKKPFLSFQLRLRLVFRGNFIKMSLLQIIKTIFGLLFWRRAPQPRPQRNSSPLPQKSPRRVRFTSFYYHQKTLKIWRWIFLSTPLDILLLLVLRGQTANSLSIFYIVILGIVLAISPRTLVRHAFLKFRDLQRKQGTLLKRHSRLVMVILFLLSIVEVLIKMSGQGVLIIAALLVIGIQAWRAIGKSVKEKQEIDSKLNSDRIFWVEETNRQIYWINLAPIVGARILSILGVCVALQSTAPLPESLLFLGFAIFLLIVVYPSREYFIMPCSRCGWETSRALEMLRYCPKCNPQAFNEPIEQTEEISPLRPLPRVSR